MARRANGEGSIYKRADGRWCGTVSLDLGKRRSFYGKTRQDVARKLATAIKARQDGLPVPGERQTVGPFLADWLVGAKPVLRPRTHARYEQIIRIHALPFIGRLPLAKVGPEHLQRLYRGRLDAGQSPASVRQLHAVLHRAFGQADRWGLVARNVADLVSPPRVSRREMTALTPEQGRALLDAAQSDRLVALYVVALTTGLREGELLAARWPNVDLENAALHVTGTLQRTPGGFVIAEPKTSRSRRKVSLTQTAVDSLRRHRVKQAEERLRSGSAWQALDLVFATEVGGYIDGSNLLRRSFRPLLASAGLPRIRFHDLRHTAATLLLGRGVHPKIVSEMLGHSQIAITLDLYSHVTPTMQREAVDALDAVFRS